MILHRNEGSACCISHRAGRNLKIEQLSKSYRLILAKTKTDLTPPRLFKKTTRQEKTAFKLTKAHQETRAKRIRPGEKVKLPTKFKYEKGLVHKKAKSGIKNSQILRGFFILLLLLGYPAQYWSA